MARAKGSKEYNTFVNGIITEANALTFPENASLDEANFVLNRDGSRQRRLGIDYEGSYSLSEDIAEQNFSEGAISSHTWINVGGNAGLALAVIQTGNLLHFYDSSGSEVSPNKHDFVLDLSNYQLDSITNGHTYKVTTAAIRGYFIVCGEHIEPFWVGYNKIENSFYIGEINPKIRDFFGVEDALELDENPTTLSNEHTYNLKNQGWNDTNISAYFTAHSNYPNNTQIWTSGKDSNDDFDASLLVKQFFGNTPAPKGNNIFNVFHKELYNTTVSTGSINISNWYIAGGQSEITITTSTPHGLSATDQIVFRGVRWTIIHFAHTLYQNSPINGKQVEVVSTPTPTTFTIKFTHWSNFEEVQRAVGGSFSYHRISGTDPFIEAEEEFRFTSVSSYAGRAWYAGLQNSDRATYIFFTRTLEQEKDFDICYQEADPTSEEISDIIDTDGGYIIIPEINNVNKLISLRDSLLVFAENGVWQIRGDGDNGFTATSYSVTKITSVGTEYPDTVVSVEGGILYWSVGGIYALQSDQISGALNATNLSATTIQSLYTDISSAARLYAKGSYDKASKRVSWLYNSDSSFIGVSYRNKYDKELVFDTVLGAFYKNEISSLASNTPYVSGVIQTQDLQQTNATFNVVVNNDQVQVNGDNVQMTISTLGRGTFTNKFLTIVPQAGGANSKITFSSYINSSFLDWKTADGTGVDYSSYLYTGYDHFGTTQREKNVKYVHTHMQRTETGFTLISGDDVAPENPSSLFMQAQWGWSDHINSGRWGRAQQVYRLSRMYIPTGVGDSFDYGFAVITTKNKLRGHGKALSLYFYSEAGKDAHLLGWGVDVSAQTNT